MMNQVQAAKEIRKELKAKFPGIKFSVRSDSFAGGDSVRISYTDGVPSDAVNAIVKKYEYGSFDGMTDMYNYDNVNDALPQSKYVQVQRDISPEVRATVKAQIAKDFGFTDPSDEQEWHKKLGQWSDQTVWREVSKMTI